MSIPTLIRRRLQLKLSPQQVAEVTGLPAAAVDDVLAAGVDNLSLASVERLAALFQFDGVSELQAFRNDLPSNAPDVHSGSPADDCQTQRWGSRVLATLAGWGNWIDTFVLAEQTSIPVAELPTVLTRLAEELDGAGLRISSTDSAVRLVADPEIYTAELADRLQQYRLNALDPSDETAHYIHQAMHSPDGIRMTVGEGDLVDGLVSGAYFEHQAQRVLPTGAVQFSIWDPLAFVLRPEDK